MSNLMSTEKRRTPLGHFLVRERYRRGLSQLELAELAGLSEPTIIAIETGRSLRVAPKTLYKIGEALGVDAGELFDLMEQAGEEGEH